MSAPRRASLRDVRAELLERGNFPAAKFIPMPLMDSKQFDKQYHRVVFSQSMFIAPLGNGLGEFLVEVGRLSLLGLRHHILRAEAGRRRIRFRRKVSAATFEAVAGRAG